MEWPEENPTLKSQRQPKRALVLSGGGVKGAWQVGVLKRLVLELGTKYQVLTGISVGALNSSLLSMYPLGDEEKAFTDLLDVWMGIKDDAIYRQWCPFLELEAAWKPSVYNSTPLKELVRSKLSTERLKGSGKELRVGAVGLRSGKYRLFSQMDDDIVEAVIASSAFPAMLTPAHFANEIWTDGGVKTIAPVASAIAMGADELDILVTAPEDNPKDMLSPSALDVAFRTIDLMSDALIEKDLKMAQKYNQFVKLAPEAGEQLGIKHIPVRIFRPTSVLIENSLDFDPEGIQRMMDIGYRDAVAQLAAAQLTADDI